ncbi:relaxase domain-containing protein [Rothia sp. AR01]|uniref:Relaxase domain-containing protein n=1 Tax=Rothia santali TaxID=2949643 RepID=A0A9X2HCN9_9MICC|nr:MobF family relaxase [Rothia santali]MCP3425835.1 relaxase domain-containing protein [Rothia santali]
MTVSISRMSIQYYLSSIATGDTRNRPKQLTNYYTGSGDPSGSWYGKGTATVGLASGATVTQQDAVSLYEEGKNPATGQHLGKKPIASATAPEGAKTPMGKAAKSTRKPVGGFDLTFSVPKSVSALWAVADASTQAKVHAAHQRATRTCLDWVEANVIQSRAGDGGIVKVPVEGMIASLFDHFDSREGDPQLHTHAVIANRVQRVSDGKWVTLDSYTLHRWTVAISEMYNATLYDELATTVGAVAEQRDPIAQVSESDVVYKNRRVELTGIPDALIAEFSTRSLAIEARKDELIEQREATHAGPISKAQIIKLRQQATLETRNSKPQEKESLQLRLAQWQNRARQLSLTPAKIVAAATGMDHTQFTAADFNDAALEEISSFVLARVSENHPTFTEANVAASAHRLMATVRFRSLADREATAKRITRITLGQAVQLTPQRYELDHLTQEGLSIHGHSAFDTPSEWRFTTEEIMSTENDLMVAADAKTGAHLTDEDQAEQILEEFRTKDGHTLAHDQRKAAYDVAVDVSEISAIIGPAGTGKTTTLAGLRAAWEAEHGQDSIIGLAPSAAAAQVLAKDLGVETDNTAKWLYETVGPGVAQRAERYANLTRKLHDLEERVQRYPDSAKLSAALDATRTRLTDTIADQSRYQLRKGQLLIIDEASMSSTADLHQLHAQVKAAGAKMLLVGDPKQLDAVDAGGFLGWMERSQRAANLTSVWRFKSDWEAATTLKLRDGQSSTVVKDYFENGRIDISNDALEAAYTSWQADIDAGKSSVLIAARKDQVQALNDRAQTDRVESGDVDPSQEVALRYGPGYLGDTILARMNQRTLLDENGDYIKNGTRMTLTNIADSGEVTARREDTGAEVTLPKDYLAESVELGYACTVFRSQGMTVDTGHVTADESFSRESLYVAMTRGKESNRVYLNTPDEDAASQGTPDPWKMMRPIATENPLETLAGIIKHSDTDLTAHEQEDAEHGWANDLGRSTNELDYVLTVSATRRAYTWIRETTGEEPMDSADQQPIQQLVRLVKDHDVDLETLPKSVQTIPEAVAQLRGLGEEEKPRLLVVPTEHTTPDEAEVQQQMMGKIDARAQQIMHLDKDEPWLIQAKAEHPTALREILQWRALSHQEDADTPLGEAPNQSEKRLSFYWDRLQRILETADQEEQEQLPAPEIDWEDLYAAISETEWNPEDYPDMPEVEDPAVQEQHRAPELG